MNPKHDQEWRAELSRLLSRGKHDQAADLIANRFVANEALETARESADDAETAYLHTRIDMEAAKP